MRGISGLAENRLASQEGLCSMSKQVSDLQFYDTPVNVISFTPVKKSTAFHAPLFTKLQNFLPRVSPKPDNNCPKFVCLFVILALQHIVVVFSQPDSGL